MNKELDRIARDVLGLATLETRKSDGLDFHDLAVWKIREALADAYLAMTGAKQLCDLGDGIMFNLPRGAKNKANKVAIRLAGDLYTVKFYSLRGVNVTERGDFEMVYGDRLAALFTEQTGFDTHL